MKIHNRNLEHYCLLTFVLSAIVFVQVVFCLSHNMSILELASWKATPYFHYVIFFIALITIWSLYLVKKHSDKMLLLLLVLVTLQSFFLLSISFSKIILIFNFIYLIFAFYFFVSWEAEKSKACFNPNFSKNDIEKESRFPITGLFQIANNEKTYPITVTNLNEDSCFILFESDEAYQEIFVSGQSKRSHVKLQTVFSGIDFMAEGLVITSYDRGIGILFTPNHQHRLNWSELYKVCLERGIA